MTDPFETDEQRRQREFTERVGRAIDRAIPYVAPVLGVLAVIGIIAALSKK